MKKRSFYIIISILLLSGVLAYEFYLKEKESNETIANGKQVKHENLSFYLPTSTTNEIIHHEGYSLSYNERHEQAEWVAYELKKSHLSRNQFKRPLFEIDRSVPTAAASWRNYRNSGYDKGHLCPAADRKYSYSAFEETFLTSNISPQRKDFNAGIWNRLEQKVRYWANRYDGVFVMTGGVLSEGLPTIGNEKVSIPNYFYKVILDEDENGVRIIGFLVEHLESSKSLYEYSVPVDSIEKMTGIDFFPKLDDSIEERLESKNQHRYWLSK